MPSGSVKVAAFVGAFLLLAVFFTWFSNTGVSSPTGALISNFGDNSADASLDLFVMSQCPYGVQAEDLIMPIIENFDGDVDFNLYFIARESGDGFSSLHGQPEVDENMRQLCIIKNNPDKFFDYLREFNPDYRNAETSFEAAADAVGLDAEAIRACSETQETKELFIENIEKSGELQVSGSPTIYINGAKYSGSRSEQGITTALCEAIPNSDVCANIEVADPVSVTVVNDLDCALCDAASLISQLKGIVPSLKVETISHESTEGSELINTFSATSLPILVFDPSIETSAGYATLQQYLVKQGDLYLLRVPGVKQINREELADSVSLFIMSQCPYGTMAQATLKEVVTAMPELNWDIRFIANANGDGTFDSLHGQPEVDENIVQVCILKYAKDKYFDYTTAYIAEYNACGDVMAETQDYAGYQTCLANIDSYPLIKKVGISDSQIRTCAEGAEGTRLFTENIADSNQLEIGSSPTFLFNNVIQGSGASAEQLKQSICSMNTGLTGCDALLSQNQAAASGQC